MTAILPQLFSGMFLFWTATHGWRATKLGVASRVRFLGFVNQSQLPAVYTSADLFVIPSSYDPCPVVLSDQIRGRFDLVRPGETGDIFPCGDINALAASIQKLLRGAVGLAEMKLNALRRMVTWSPRENVSATVEAIRIAKFSKAAGKR